MEVNITANDISAQQQAIIKRAIQVGSMLLVFAASLFISAGRLGWVAAWAYLGLYVGMIAANALFMDRELVVERARVGEGTKDWDRVLGSLALLAVTPGALIVSGLDERLGWSQTGLGVQIAAAAFVALGHGLTVWAMAANRYFSATVRIQEERAHAAISGGPYRFVRHPGYLAYTIAGLATPLMLDSLWGLLPSLLGLCAILARTSLEDRTLRAELPGYADYARRVHYRLLPGIW
jgi:protein-S-isoprenylcysteine O-methyltransferase Ste14